MNPVPIIIGGVIAAVAAVVAKKKPGSASVELDANLPPTTAQQVLGALANEQNPQNLLALAAQLAGSYPLAAAALRARAAQLGGAPAPAQQAPRPSAGPSPSPSPSPKPPTVIPPAGVQPSVNVDITPGRSVHAAMSADEWNQTMVLLNDWLGANAMDPGLSYIDLSFYRGNVDDLGDTGNMELAVDALQAWLNQRTGSTEAGGTAGTFDAYAAAGLYLWADANPGLVHANESILRPFSVPLVTAVKNSGQAINVSGARAGKAATRRLLPRRLALRRPR